MIRILLLVALLITGLISGPKLIGEKGYVLIAMDTLTIEMSVVSLAVILLLVVIGFLLLEWLIKRIVGAISGTQSWFSNIGHRNRQKAITRGLLAMAEGNLLEAKTQLEKIEQADFDGVNLLALAEVETQLANHPAAVNLWQHALEYKDARVAATLKLCDHALAQQDPTQALTLLEALDDKQQKQKQVLMMWSRVLAEGGQWQQLKGKLKGWKKILGDDYQHWMQRASHGTFAEIASKQGANQLKQSWQQMPRATRKDPAQQAAYVQQLIEQGMYQDAEKALVEYQKSGPNPLLLPLYKQLRNPSPAAALRQLENWLKKDENNPELLSTLGHLAYHSGDINLAEKALAKAIKLSNNQQDVLLMAELKERQQDNQQALALYKQSLGQSPVSQ